MEYNEEYYKTLNYVDYLSRQDRYTKLATEVTDLLKKLNLIDEFSAIMDYGCATGMLVKALQDLGYGGTFGFDISDWATQQAKKIVQGSSQHIISKSDLVDLVTCYSLMPFNIMFCLDVLEHMEDASIRAAFSMFPSDTLIVRIPCSTNEGKSFHLDVSNRDKSHINCKTKEEWIKFFKYFGYNNVFKLNLLTIYDSEGVFCALLTK